MVADDYERGRRALRRRLALDFEPLRDTLARGLDLAVQDEAAIYCTATVEALCETLFTAALLQIQGTGDAAVTVSHLQLALRTHSALRPLLRRVPSAGLALGFFLDDATSRALHERRLIASSDAPHLRRRRRPSPTTDIAAEIGDEDEIEWHARARREWTRRADDPFADEDFAAVLKGVHPAFSLSYNATALLSALVRELLNAACDQLPLDDADDAERLLTAADVSAALDRVLGPADDDSLQDENVSLFRFMTRTARECVARFTSAGEDVSCPSTVTDVRFRVVHASASAAALLSPPLGLSLPNVPTSTPFDQLLPLMCKRGHLVDDRGTWLVVYRGREVDARATPGMLGLPIVSGSFPSASGSLPPADALIGMTLAAINVPFVFLVPRKWWDDARRNEARRGRLASQRPQDARVRSLVASSESKVKRALRRSPSPSAGISSALLQIPMSQSKRSSKRSHSRSAATLIVTSPASSLPTSFSTVNLHSETSINSGDDSLSELADALRTAACEAEAAATRMKRMLRPPEAVRDEWTIRVHALDVLVERTHAARAAAAQILARVEGEDGRP